VDALASAVQVREGERVALVEQARAAVPEELGIDGETLSELARAAQGLARSLEGSARAAEAAVERLRSDLDKRRALEGEIEAHDTEQAVYAALGRELRDDHILQFLRAEALAVLAADASRRLMALSGDRYRLLHDNDEFFVVDAWNGDERRSVRTLSGGETFLASLALALALSEQIQLMSVSEKSRLDSLFLDEGFGNLDAEALEVVVGAVEQLGGDGRLVGVITHVAEVAARMPVRLRVTKSPRGSTIERSDGPLEAATS
jgi:exonuclease SbcC